MENTKTTATVVTPVFQNGKATVIAPQVTVYVERYQMFARKTAESIIGLATTLLEAEQELNGVDFALFCDEVGLKKGDTTYSKLRKIGAAAARLKRISTNCRTPTRLFMSWRNLMRPSSSRSPLV